MITDTLTLSSALEVAAGGRHHLLVTSNDPDLRARIPWTLSLLIPSLTAAQTEERARILSAAGVPATDWWSSTPPVRRPHHSSTVVALVGGGTSALRPGELSLAHHGLLVIDEPGEFPLAAIDALRQPLEEGVVRVARARTSVTLPADFHLVVTTPSCACAAETCTCSEPSRLRFRRRISGPIYDRLGVRIALDDMPDPLPSTADMLGRVRRAQARDRQRGVVAAKIPAADLNLHGPLTDGANRHFEEALRVGRISARGLARARRVAITISDLLVDDDRLDEPKAIGWPEAAAALDLTAPLPKGP